MIKRFFDIVFSALALLILAPVLVPVIIVLRFTGEGEVFYRQERLGFKNKPFYITKFATMLKDSPNMGTGEYTLQNDPRVLPMGSFLRKSKINEFPQFWDIFIGNMSFVGPRPQMIKVHESYPKEYEEVLAAVKPGLTGVASIIFRDEESIMSRAKNHALTFTHELIPYKAELESWYKNKQSFFGDLQLILITAWVIVKPESNIIFKVFPSIPYKDKASFGQITLEQ